MNSISRFILLASSFWCVLIIGFAVLIYNKTFAHFRRSHTESNLKDTLQIASHLTRDNFLLGDISSAIQKIHEIGKSNTPHNLCFKVISPTQETLYKSDGCNKLQFKKIEFELAEKILMNPVERYGYELKLLSGESDIEKFDLPIEVKIFAFGLTVFFIFGIAFISFLIRSLIKYMSNIAQKKSTNIKFFNNFEEVRQIEYLIRENKRNEELRIRSEMDLLRTNAITELALRVAHDIQSPVSALNMVLKGIVVEEPGHLNLAFKALGRISQIIDKLLEESKTQSTREIVKLQSPQRANAIDVLKEIVIQKKIEFPKSIINLTYLKEHNDLYVTMESSDLYSIVSNMLNNSIQAIDDLPQGEIHISTEVSHSEMQISVRDNGRGMPGDLLEKLGKKRVISSKENGNGIGLLNSLRLVKNAGGSFKIESEVGRGTLIRLYIPIVQ